MESTQLDDYRALQRQRYLEREKERQEAEEKALRVAREKEEKITEALRQIDVYCNLAKSTTNLREMIQIMERFKATLENTNDLPKQSLMGKGLDLLEHVNGNMNISVDMHDQRAKAASDNLKELVKNILTECGIDAEGMDLEFDMDCSRDEEIARALSNTYLDDYPRTRGRRSHPTRTASTTTQPSASTTTASTTPAQPSASTTAASTTAQPSASTTAASTTAASTTPSQPSASAPRRRGRPPKQRS